MSTNQVQQAIKIATNALRACYAKEGILAGTHHFTDYWARDAYFAALGSLAVGDTEVVEKMVKAFFSFQRKDGLLPYRIMRGPISLSKYWGKPKFYKHPRPTYRLRNIGPEVLDGTTLSILFAALLKKRTLIPQIKAALTYLVTREKHQLLWDGPMGEWNDAVWKWGNLLYSNVIYWYMYDRLADWAKSFDKVWCQELSSKRDQLTHALHARLWNGQYFSDWHDYQREDYFYPFGNCLAIAWGLATPSETKSILSQCEKHAINFSLETNSPQYPWWRVDLLQRLCGMADYQNHGILWWQPMTSYLAALKQAGKNSHAQELSVKLAKKIVKDQTIYECYERNGLPVKRLTYTAEHPFAWASGMILWGLSYNKPDAKK